MSAPQRSAAAPLRPPSSLPTTAPKVRALHPSVGSALVLHVLSGTQRGAQARISQQRILVGNLLDECDVVIDTGNSGPSLACLIRASQDGWRVLAIAGPLWVGSQRVAPEQAVTITQGVVITLGPAEFCIGDPRRIDFSRVAVPTHQDKPLKDVRANAANKDHAMIPKLILAGWYFLSTTWRSLRLKASRQTPSHLTFSALLIIAAACAALAVYLFTSVHHRSNRATQTAPQQLQTAQAALSVLPWARELTLQADPQQTQSILINGYLLERQQAAAIDSALHQTGLQAQHRWTAINELQAELALRIALASPQDRVQLQHTAQGHFELAAPRHQFEALDPRIRRAFQELVALQAITLQLSPSADTASNASGRDAVLHYTRSPSVPSGVTVQGLDTLALLHPPPDVRELRLGALPSIVLANGERYFIGSALPGGAFLRSIEPRQLRVQIGTQLQRIGLGQQVRVLNPLQSE